MIGLPPLDIRMPESHERFFDSMMRLSSALKIARREVEKMLQCDRGNLSLIKASFLLHQAYLWAKHDNDNRTNRMFGEDLISDDMIDLEIQEDVYRRREQIIELLGEDE